MARLISVVGVTESVARPESAELSTTTVCVAVATGSTTCRMGLVPEASVSGCETMSKPGSRDLQAIDPDGRLGQRKGSLAVSGRAQRKCAICRLKCDRGPRDRPMMWVVNHAMQSGENSRHRRQ